MFKMIIRVAIAFAVVWMLVPHGPDIGFARPGLAAAMAYFGWQRAPGDADRLPLVALNTRASAVVLRAAKDCVSATAPKRLGPNASAWVPACTDRAARRSSAGHK